MRIFTRVTISPRAKSGLPPVFVKFYWKKAILICLDIAYGCFCTTVAELNSCDKETVACKT